MEYTIVRAFPTTCHPPRPLLGIRTHALDRIGQQGLVIVEDLRLDIISILK